jgi:hypothetical protein
LASTYVSASIAAEASNEGSLTLFNEITALRLCKPSESKYCSAIPAELPKGAVLTICGSGFNHRTMTVRWNNDTYYVFERDLNQID